MKRFAILALLLVVSACAPSSTEITNTLVGDGFDAKSLAVANPSYFFAGFAGCSKGDKWSAVFTGTKNNMSVKGVVCGSTFKSPTIRIDKSVPILRPAADSFVSRADAIIASRRAALIDSLKKGLIR